MKALQRVMMLGMALVLLLALPLTAQSEAAESPTAYTAEDFTALKPDDVGEAVLAIQLRLQQLGYYTGRINSELDEATCAAVSAFRAANQIEEDGAVTPELQQVLFNAGALDSEGNAAELWQMPDAPYVGNTNTRKFHRANCDSVSDILDKNKTPLYDRDVAVDEGYQPCKRCNP